MANLVPVPGDLPTSVVDALTAGSPLSGTNAGPRTSPVVRYIAAIRRVKWLVLLLTIAGVGGGLIVSRLRPESYSVDGELQLSPDESSPYIGSQYQTYIQTMQIIEPIAIARRLYIIGPKRTGGRPVPPGPSGRDASLFNDFSLGQDPVAGDYRLKFSADRKSWELTNTGTAEKDRGNVGDSLGRKFGFQWLPVVEQRWGGETFDFTILTSREAAEDVKKHMHIELLPAGAPRFMHLTLDGQDGPQTAAILNDLMTRFVQQTSIKKRENLTAQVHVFDSLYNNAYAKLQADEMKLGQFKIKTITLPRDQLPVAPGLQQTTPSAYNSYLAQRGTIDELKRDRRELIGARSLLMSGKPSVDAFVRIPSVKQSLEFSQALTSLVQTQAEYDAYHARGFTDTLVSPVAKIDMPALAKRLVELRTKIVPDFANNLITNLSERIALGDSETSGAEKELQAIPQRSIEENSLAREELNQEGIVAELQKQLYAAKSKEAGASTDVGLSQLAVAGLRPNKNRTSLIIALGTLIGLAAGLGLALLLDMTDKRVRYADQVTGGLGLTILGVIPEIRRTKGKQPTVEEAAQVIEAFRTVRLNLAHTIGQGSVVLTISSPSPGDGKSLVSSNLALSFAESGYRTLLIDGDSRRGELHRTFGTDRRPGLLDYLVGELPLENLLRPTSHDQLRIITGGSRRRNAPELLGTTRMKELITKMRDQFDVILIDSPPMGAGIDPFVLATLTGNLMLVLRAGATERDLAEAKLQIVDQLPIRIVGAVLNDVRATMNDYKYYSYTYGYGSVDEPKEATSITARSTPES